MQIRKVARKNNSSRNDVKNHAIFVSDGSLCSSMYDSIKKVLMCFHIKDKFKKYMPKKRKEQIRLGIYIQILTWKLLLLPFSIHFHKSFYLIPFQKGIHDFPRISSIPTQSDISREGLILLICPKKLRLSISARDIKGPQQ